MTKLRKKYLSKGVTVTLTGQGPKPDTSTPPPREKNTFSVLESSRGDEQKLRFRVANVQHTTFFLVKQCKKKRRGTVRRLTRLVIRTFVLEFPSPFAVALQASRT